MKQIGELTRAPAVLGAALALALACGPSGRRDIGAISDPGIGHRDGGSDASDARPDLADAPFSATDPGPDAFGESAIDLPGGTPEADPFPPDTAPPVDTAPSTRPNGSACSGPNDCESSHCVDGVCCATACGEPCHVCNAEGSRGSCTAVPAGDDPRDHCKPEPVQSCGQDGTCDGNGACRRYPANTECEPAGCLGTGMEKSARLCDGNGACQDATMRACTGPICQNGSCGNACSASTPCLAGYYCEGGACRTKRAQGQTCTAGPQCVSGNCVAGICCNTACDRACQACNLAGRVGTCSPVAAGEDPGDRCPTDPASSCNRDGACDGNGQCRLYAQGTSCGAASCAEGVAQAARTCDGRGTCSTLVRTACAPYLCGTDACATTCTPPGGCAAGFACNGTTCSPEGLVLRWTFDEEAGAAFAGDLSGNNYSGGYGRGGETAPTASADVPAVRFPNPRSRAFDATKDQVVHITPLPQVLRDLRTISISVWYRATALPPPPGDGAELVSFGDNHLLRLHRDDDDPNKLGFEVTKYAPASSTKRHKCIHFVATPAAGMPHPHLDGRWHHLAAVIENTGIKLYYDGNPLTCTFTPNPLPVAALGGDVPDGDFTVGRHGTVRANPTSKAVYDFTGNIDDVRIYNRALTPAEITSLSMGNP